MESEVQKAPQVSRSELDAAFDVCRGRRWMVVQGMSATPWGYVVFTPGGTQYDYFASLDIALELSEDR